MKKFLSFPITGTGETTQLLSVDGIIIVEQASTTEVTITYAGSAAATDVATITFGAAFAANDNTARDRVQDSIIAALQTSWTNPKYDVSLTGLVDATGAAATITGIAVA
ncbi:MAG: hypothetical protein GOVbin1678_3 [Prokaryotic dsDNA virus sp.]|nr:MAG: hypothetical protein GOVbin1678_3 [Prokaryotic dsDNA virus sp.]|tara:strand:- start:56530 stop:56856 length:327 start_codon:yes stop_codon:yes gene_type:complete